MRVRLVTSPKGPLDAPAYPNPVVLVHAGPPIVVGCHRDGARHSGRALFGDIDIIPTGIPSFWQVDGVETVLALSLPLEALKAVAETADIDPARITIANRFQVRDPRIERIAWRLHLEHVAGGPNGTLQEDSLAADLAAALLDRHSSAAKLPPARGGLSGNRLRRILGFIEDNLESPLRLAEIAAVAGLSLTHVKTAFRQSMGCPIHQYVIRRRVQSAARLLRQGNRSILQTALDCGFAHPTHLAYHTRRLLGLTPADLQR